MHKDWCGKPCSECQSPCELDKSIPCSPDCECLGPNGETDSAECRACDSKNFEDKWLKKKPDFTNHTGDDYPN